MSSVLRFLKILLTGALGLIVAALVVGFSYRAYLQRQNADAIAITTPNGIEEALYVNIGGIDQWIQIRGQDRAKPVLLLLNGGPGASWIRATQALLPWEEHFVFVQWDQRGAGRTYATTGDSVASTMSVDRMVDDAIEVVEFLRAHLGKDKIILLGHSWGSFLGIHLASQRPDLFYCFVGTGQLGDFADDVLDRYSSLLRRVEESGDEQAQQALIALGQPPYDRAEDYLTLIRRQEALEPGAAADIPPIQGALTAPGYSLLDFYHLVRGFQLSERTLVPEVFAVNLSAVALNFDIPIFFFHGDRDFRTPIESARAYFDRITAPHKEFVTFPGAGHFVFLSPGAFLMELVARVLPLASTP